MLSAPLLMTCDIRNMDEDTKRILTNQELIAVNQDKSGQQARRIHKDDSEEIWAKQLADGSWAVGFLNRDNKTAARISLDLRELGMDKSVKVRDLWLRKDLSIKASDVITFVVKPHECKVVKITRK